MKLTFSSDVAGFVVTIRSLAVDDIEIVITGVASPVPENGGGPYRAAADCRASPEPAARAVNADPSSGRVSPDESTSQGSEVGNEAEVARVVPPPTVLDEASVIAIREALVEVAPTPDIPTAMATIRQGVERYVEHPPAPVERPAELALRRFDPETDDLAIPGFLDCRRERAA